jgi:hypothetical protein
MVNTALHRLDNPQGILLFISNIIAAFSKKRFIFNTVYKETGNAMIYFDTNVSVQQTLIKTSVRQFEAIIIGAGLFYIFRKSRLPYTIVHINLISFR